MGARDDAGILQTNKAKRGRRFHLRHGSGEVVVLNPAASGVVSDDEGWLNGEVADPTQAKTNLTVVVMFVGLGVAGYFLYKDPNATRYDWFTTMSAIVGASGLAITLIQIFDLQKRTDAVRQAVTETKDKLARAITASDAAKCRSLASQAYNHGKGNEIQAAVIRMEYLWEALLNLEQANRSSDPDHEKTRLLTANLQKLVSDLNQKAKTTSNDRTRVLQLMQEIIRVLTNIEMKGRYE